MDTANTAVKAREATFIGKEEGDWVFSAPGVTKKVLYSNEESGELTLLLRFEMGSAYPLHNHPGKEEIFVLEGDVHPELVGVRCGQ